jgi:hypothetical protein
VQAPAVYEDGLLRSFLVRWQQHGCPWPIRADFAMDWVMEDSSIGKPYRDEHRLLAVRAFLLQVRTFEGLTGVPQIQFCKRFKRRTPYIFSDQEIQKIMEAEVRKQTPFRAVTVRTINRPPMILAGPLLQRYFTDYLIAQRRLSPQTLASYRDTFRLLLQFVQSELKIEPSRLAVDQLDAEIILRFLDSLELQRKNAVVSRNLRLTAYSYPLVLPHGGAAGPGVCWDRNSSPCHSDEANRYATPGVRLPRRDGCHPEQHRPQAVVWAAGLRPAANYVQLRRSRL